MQNIVVDTEQSLVKIIDFGLSNYWSLEEPLSTHCGSPEYAAPELFVPGRKYGPEVDLWSLGVVMFCMSAGCLPFCLYEREQSLSHDHQRRLLVTRIRKGMEQKHKNCVSHYSKDFSNLISGLLTTKPYQRFRIEQVLCHPWITKNPTLLLDIPKTITPGTNINERIILKMCTIVSCLPKEMEKRIGKQPLGPMGGIHRILYHKELKRHWRLLEPFSPLHTLSGSLSSGSLVTKQHNKIMNRTNAAKAKSAETCKTDKNNVDDSVYTSSPQDTETQDFCLENYQESEMKFREEPWSSNFSSAIMNKQTNLIVPSLRSKTCLYNYRKTQFNNREEVNNIISLNISDTTEVEDRTTRSVTSTVQSTRSSTRSERRSVPSSKTERNRIVNTMSKILRNVKQEA